MKFQFNLPHSCLPERRRIQQGIDGAHAPLVPRSCRQVRVKGDGVRADGLPADVHSGVANDVASQGVALGMLGRREELVGHFAKCPIRLIPREGDIAEAVIFHHVFGAA